MELCDPAAETSGTGREQGQGQITQGPVNRVRVWVLIYVPAY